MNEKINFHPQNSTGDFTFSIIIPTWNNFELLKLCIRSIEENSIYKHQIIVHVNEEKEEITSYLKNKNIDFTSSKSNVGICKSVNACRALAKTDLLLYINDDMYVCPNWDKPLVDEVKIIGHHYFFLSGTMIEPRETGNNCVIAPHDFGNSPENFQEEALKKSFATFPFSNFTGTTWPPSLIHKELWDMVGGFSIEFSPGMYSDPDLCMKLWQCGVRIFKGLGESRVYHFMSKSTGRVEKNNGKKQFLKKWGISASYFMNEILNRGEEYQGPTTEKEFIVPFKDKIKRLLP